MTLLTRFHAILINWHAFGLCRRFWFLFVKSSRITMWVLFIFRLCLMIFYLAWYEVNLTIIDIFPFGCISQHDEIEQYHYRIYLSFIEMMQNKGSSGFILVFRNSRYAPAVSSGKLFFIIHFLVCFLMTFYQLIVCSSQFFGYPFR